MSGRGHPATPCDQHSGWYFGHRTDEEGRLGTVMGHPNKHRDEGPAASDGPATGHRP